MTMHRPLGTPSPARTGRSAAFAGLLLIGLTVAWTGSTHAQLAAQPYFFDAGPPDAAVAADARPLGPGDTYLSDAGFGWTTAPETAYVRSNLTRSRGDALIDGVTGPALGFRADLPAGAWWVTFWMEAGVEQTSTATVAVGDEAPAAPDWHAFAPPAEPSTVLSKQYRIYQRRVDVGDAPLELHIAGGQDSVRVLALSLIPDPVPTTAAHEALLDRIRAAGRYHPDSLLALAPIQADLAALRDQDPNDAFAAFWQQQLSLLEETERRHALRGWSWGRRQTGLSIFDQFYQAVMEMDALLMQPPEANPLHERALWQRGRILYWLGLEQGGENDIKVAAADLVALQALHPDDALLAMYNGASVELPDPCDALTPAPGAPEWSVLQQEALCRMHNEARWWVTVQQDETGELGGKLGDDVEILRWWPALVLWGDTLALRGYRRLADGVWNSDEIADGFAAEVSDVEHASEFISDTAPLMALFSDDPAYTDRLRPSARHFETLWTGLTPNGHRHFRSSWYSSSEIDTEPPKDRDVEYNTRTVKAIRYLAHQTGDTSVVRLLHEWSSAWRDAAMRTDKGKPAGLIPPSIRFPDEALNGDAPTWHVAGMYWDYFDWDHHAGSMMLDQLLYTWVLTGDETLLQPLFATLDLIEKYGDEEADTPDTGGRGPNPDDESTRPAAEPGSEAWAVALLREKTRFWNVVEQWRLLTGDTRYDDLILRYGTAYARYRLTGDEALLVEGLEPVLETVRYNTTLRTEEALHTDRVYVPGATHLQAMLTGGTMAEDASPYLAASWSGTDSTFTALVTDAGPERLGLKVFSHAGAERTVDLHLHRLRAGTYRLTRTVEGREPEETTVTVVERGTLPLTLPPQTLLDVTLEKAP